MFEVHAPLGLATWLWAGSARLLASIQKRPSNSQCMVLICKAEGMVEVSWQPQAEIDQVSLPVKVLALACSSCNSLWHAHWAW